MIFTNTEDTRFHLAIDIVRYTESAREWASTSLIESPDTVLTR